MNNTDYLFMSANLRAREMALLSGDRLERMVEAPDFDEAAKVLTECGYPDLSGATDKELEAAFLERRQRWRAVLEGTCPEPALATAFRRNSDFLFAMVLVKAEGAGIDGAYLLSPCGRVSPQVLQEAYQEDEWRRVPSALAAAIKQAKTTLARTSNPQLSDMGLDKAYFAELLSITKSLSSDFYTSYVKLSIDTANLRSAVRCIRGHMDEGVLKAALVEDGNISADRIAKRVYNEGVTAVFTERALAHAAELGQQAIEGAPLAGFERECDDVLTRFLEEAKMTAFGPEIAVAFIASMEGEIIAARMVLLGKRSGLSPDELRERLRDSYV